MFVNLLRKQVVEQMKELPILGEPSLGTGMEMSLFTHLPSMSHQIPRLIH